MSKITFGWADGEYTFALRLGEIRELQEKTGAGPMVLLRRMYAGDWNVDDLRETIRLGLMGGGIDPQKALKLVERYVDGRPLLESVKPAQAIIGAAVLGPANGDKAPKSRAARVTAEQSTNSQTDSSPLPPSTEPPQPSDSSLETSTP